MSAGIHRLDVPPMTRWEQERVRQACIEEGLLDEDDLLELDDIRIFTM